MSTLFVHGLAALFLAIGPVQGGSVSGPNSWSSFSPTQIRAAYPGLSPVWSQYGADGDIYALQQLLSQTQLSPEALAAEAPERQEALFMESLEAYAQAVLKKIPAEPAPSSSIPELAEQEMELHNLTAVRRFLPLTMGDALFQAEASASARRAAQSSELIQSKIQQLASGAGLRWQGRTALIDLDDGSVLAFKTSYSNPSLSQEAELLERTRRMGLKIPIALSPRTLTYEREFAPGNQAKGRYLLPYLIPKAIGKDYLTYLNDKLPAALSRKQKAQALETAALRSIDDMILLLRHGQAHETLAPISHSGTHWEWDYWRWVSPLAGKMRFGPSTIHGWKEALTFPNMRASGLADFEHIQPLSHFNFSHDHYDHGRAAHDAYSAAIGQNLAEWALVMLHSGNVNGLTNGQTARIVVNGLKRHAEALLSSQGASSIKEYPWFRAVRSSSRRFRFIGTISSSMMGWTTHPLIMRAIKPYIEQLRAANPLGLANAPFHLNSKLTALSNAISIGVAFSILQSIGILLLLVSLGIIRPGNGSPQMLLFAMGSGFILHPLWFMYQGLAAFGRWALTRLHSLVFRKPMT